MAAGVLTFEWYPDPLVIAEEYRIAAIALEDLSVPLEESVPVVGESMRRNIESGDFVGWKDTYRRKVEQMAARGEHTGRMLQKTTALVDSVSDPGNFAVEGDNLIWTGEAAPSYAELVHFGSPERYTSGPRPFIGLTPDAEVEVLAVFERWLAEIT